MRNISLESTTWRRRADIPLGRSGSCLAAAIICFFAIVTSVSLFARGFVSSSVREALALNAFQSNGRTFPVYRLVGVPLEIPFGEIARQVRLAN